MKTPKLISIVAILLAAAAVVAQVTPAVLPKQGYRIVLTNQVSRVLISGTNIYLMTTDNRHIYVGTTTPEVQVIRGVRSPHRE